MSLLFLQQWIPETVVKAFCWTLIHSIWQGIAAALIAGLVILLTRKSAAALRYNLLAATLLTFLLASAFTFYLEFTSANNTRAIAFPDEQKNSASFSIQNETNETIQFSEQSGNIIVQFTSYFNEHAAFIVLIWFLVFLAKSIQLASGLHYIHRIRYHRNAPAPVIWKERLDLLSKQVGIDQQIIFLQSELVKVPVVIGIFKPVILVPIGLFAQLPPQQVEAILLHELAHIKRKDFLVNLFQSFTEAIYFFNPAIIWISSLIREEREACCDDIVVAIMPHKKYYLEALVSFQDHSFNSATHAMALGSKKNYLLRRVQRMLTKENKKLNIMEKSILLLGVIGITAFSFISGKDEKKGTSFSKELKTVMHAEPESIYTPFIKEERTNTIERPRTVRNAMPVIDTPKPKKTKTPGEERTSFPSISSSINDDGSSKTAHIEATDNTGKKYSIRKVDNEITELRVNGELISKDQYVAHSDAIRSIDESISRGNRPRKIYHEDRVKNREELNQKLMEKQKKTEKEKDKLRKEFEERQKEKMKDVKERKELLNKKMEQKNKERALKFKQEDSARKTRVLNKTRTLNSNLNKTNGEVLGIISELERSGVVKDRENLNFTFNNNELVVNGAKQSSELHQQLKQKYLRKDGDYINYQKNSNTTSISIHRE